MSQRAQPVLARQRASAPATADAGDRNFLFLQGLAGPFFEKLGAALAARGHGVHRVNFHGGDALFWRHPGAIAYRGRAADWPGFLSRLLAVRAITDIVLFGDCRPLHRVAIAIARERGVCVHVFEEGYLRPGWVTLEQGGVNGHSPLPRDPAWFLAEAARLPPVEERPVAVASFAERARINFRYSLAYLATAWAFPRYRTHRPWHPLHEYVGWTGRALGRAAAQARARAAARVIGALGAFFVLPLQLDSDSQVRQHSPFGGMAPAILRVVSSFARHAPRDTTLVVKEHPLDNGLTNWRRLVSETALQFGVADRVVYLEAGALQAVLNGASGMVTINSTSGTHALALSVPVITLGRAVYDLAGLTCQGGLEDFWRAPRPPDPELFAAFRKVLSHHSLLRGDFFTESGTALLVAGALGRIEAGRPLWSGQRAMAELMVSGAPPACRPAGDPARPRPPGTGRAAQPGMAGGLRAMTEAPACPAMP